MNITGQEQQPGVKPHHHKLAWSIVALAVVANVAGYVLNLYDRLWWYDDFLHFFTPFALTLLITLYLAGRVLVGVRSHRLLFILAAASLGTALGVLWEVAEWAYDQFARENVIAGKQDTIIDLILGSIGALLAGWLSATMIRTAPN